ATRKTVEQKVGRAGTDQDVLSYLMYPKVFTDFAAYVKKYGDVTRVPTEVMFYGLRTGDETEVEIEKGKTLFIKLVGVTEPDEHGVRSLFYELNGHPRDVKVVDKKLGKAVPA